MNDSHTFHEHAYTAVLDEGSGLLFAGALQQLIPPAVALQMPASNDTIQPTCLSILQLMARTANHSLDRHVPLGVE